MAAPSEDNSTISRKFKAYANRRINEGTIATLCDSTTIGTMFYDPNQMSENVANEIYRLNEKLEKSLRQEERGKANNISPKSIYKLLKEHAKTLPCPSGLDFREYTADMSASTFFFHKLLNLSTTTGKQIVALICDITGNDHEDTSELYLNPKRVIAEDVKQDPRLRPHTMKLRIQMTIALLLLIVNPQRNPLQVVLGMLSFTKGLNEKGFEILNRIGIMCSMESIRKYGHYWAKIRKASDEVVNPVHPKVSIDNLNFTMKMAKKIQDGFGGIKRQLNLITGQLIFTRAGCERIIFPQQQQEHTISINDFVQKDATQDPLWCTYLHAVISITKSRITDGIANINKSVVKTLEDHLPSFTPAAAETIVYATVQEVEPKLGPLRTYLCQLKKDLNISEPGNMQHVILCGDQQIYDLLLKLQSYDANNNCPIFSWYTPVPGDWHTLKTLGETIKVLLWDGGLKELAAKCGHNVEMYQWQDIHMLLAALHESLWMKIFKEQSANSLEELHAILSTLGSDGNRNEVCRFWCLAFHYLNVYMAYYFAIRSGNWMLRNIAFKQAIPIFASFGHHKYVKLCCDTIHRISNLPKEILQQCMNGGWTVSLKGNKYHNQAIDESHESQINKTLKEMTTRPSHFRTVELANFMAYMEPVVSSFSANACLFTATQSEQTKPYILQRMQKMNSAMENIPIFHHTDDLKAIHNIMTSKPRQLSTQAQQDLLSFKQVGEERVMQYANANFLEGTPVKKSNRKLKNFTKPKQTSRAASSQMSEQKKSLGKLFNIMKEMKKGVVKTSEYPLAIAKRNGAQFNSSKSDFYGALYSQVQYRAMFTSSIEIGSSSDVQVIMDFLRYVHRGPSESCETFADFCSQLWSMCTSDMGLKRADEIVLIFDKPEFLPKPRDILHSKRNSKRQDIIISKNDIQPNNKIPKGCHFAAALGDNEFKAALLEFIIGSMIACAPTLQPHQSIIIDSSYKTVRLERHGIQDLPQNEIGEGDYAVWYYATFCQKKTCIISCTDTDIWVYGMAVMEQKWLNASTDFYIEKVHDLDYISINTAVEAIKQDDRLKSLQNPVTSVCASYIISGGDYVSSFHYITHEWMLLALLENATFITDLVLTSATPSGGQIIQGLLKESCVRLICTAYCRKPAVNRAFPEGLRNLTEFMAAASNPHLDEQVRTFLVSNGLSDTKECAVANIEDLVEIIHTISYMKSSGALSEENTMPTYDQLIHHILRTEYTIKLAINSLTGSASHLNEWEQYGWSLKDDNIVIQWNSPQSSTQPTTRQKSKRTFCSCKGGCKSRCPTCKGNMKACTEKCWCMKDGRNICQNPYNNVHGEEDEVEVEQEEQDLALDEVALSGNEQMQVSPDSDEEVINEDREESLDDQGSDTEEEGSDIEVDLDLSIFGDLESDESAGEDHDQVEG